MAQKMTKKEAINRILVLNPNMKKVGSSDVWMGEPALINDGTGRGLKMVNMTITLPAGAERDAKGNIIYGGYTIKMWRP